MRQLATAKAKLLSYGATVLIIGPGLPSDASALATRLEVPFPVLADEDGRTYAAYGLRKVMFNTVLQSGTILIDREGVIRYARRATNPSGAFNQDALFLALRTM